MINLVSPVYPSSCLYCLPEVQDTVQFNCDYFGRLGSLLVVIVVGYTIIIALGLLFALHVN